MVISKTQLYSLIGALVLSLCLNVFAGAMAYSKKTMGLDVSDRHERLEQERLERGLSRFAQKMPDGVRQQMRQEFSSRRPQIHAAHQEVSQSRQKLRDILKQEKLDTAQLDAALKALRDSQNNLLVQLHSAFSAVVLKMPPEQRSGVLRMIQPGASKEPHRGAKRRLDQLHERHRPQQNALPEKQE